MLPVFRLKISNASEAAHDLRTADNQSTFIHAYPAGSAYIVPLQLSHKSIDKYPIKLHLEGQDEFREDCPKSVVVSETIATVRQLILQDRHVTYR